MAYIYSYQPEDQAQLELFLSLIWGDTAFPFDPDGKHADLRNISSVYQAQNEQFWLLRDEDVIIGTVALKHLASGIMEVKRLNVQAAYRGKGYGDKLFKHALAYAAENSLKRIRLDSIRNKGPVMHIYNKYGFVEIERYNDNPRADIFMELRLNS